MQHRGPDAEGVFSDGPIALCHRRLSIIDLSRKGHQPMPNADDSCWIVYNGEVYNYKELRELVPKYQFESETDTEVILALYDKYGIDCLQHLRGMFAFAIWDSDAQQLFLARDRLGQKPLFYYRGDSSFRFASTIRAILADQDLTPKPDLSAIRSYLTYQYVPHPNTGFEGIKMLGPGEYMVVGDGDIRRESYWSVSCANQFNASPYQLGKRLRETLREAVRLRMRSDVPLGVFLSGGIDSTIVTAMMAEIAEKPIKTYSIGFGEYDELEYAEAVAEEYDTDHHVHTVTPDAIEILPELIDHLEMPFGDPSAVPTYYVSKIAAENITVALGGDAGDENFAGYDRYTHDKVTAWASRVPQSVRRASVAGLNALPKVVPGSELVKRAARLLENAEKDPVRRYAQYICHMLGEEAEMVWNGPRTGDELKYLRSAFEEADGTTRLAHVMHVDLQTYLPDDLLLKIDRTSMAHSIEARSPFLDHKLVEFAARVPAKYKWRRGNKKWLLKQACRDLIPERVRGRSKQGFSVPVNIWFRGQLRNYAREKIERLGNRQAFDAQGLQEKFDAHLSGESDYGHHLWDLMMLETWYDRFID